jgi:UDP-glucose 4-epimerase
MEQFADAFAGRRCVVTGAGGFVGLALCRRLHDLGAEVHALGRSERPAASASFTSWTVLDVTEPAQVKATLGAIRPQLIFHMASKVSGSQSIAMVLPMLQANLVGFVNVALAAADLRCERIVTAGSLMEPDTRLPAVPPSPYAAAKFAASSYARMFASLYDLPVTIAKLMMVYGPGQLDFTKVVPYVTSQLLNGRTAELSSGKQQFDWIFVADVVDALLRIALTHGLAGATVDVGTGILTSVADVAAGIAGRLNASDLLKLGALPDRKAEPTRRAEVAATREILSWHPGVDLAAGLDATVAWYSRHLGHAL